MLARAAMMMNVEKCILKFSRDILGEEKSNWLVSNRGGRRTARMKLLGYTELMLKYDARSY